MPDGFAEGQVDHGQWSEELGEFVLDWDEVRGSTDPHAIGLEFARSAFRHACVACGWDPDLAASAERHPIH
jgi:hypothetical protein